MPYQRNGPVIVVSGNVASGKSSLIRLLSKHLNPSYVHFERPGMNPFVQRASRGNPRFHLPSQTWFLIDSVAALHAAHDVPGLSFLERSPAENAIFATSVLTGARCVLYRRLYRQLLQAVDPPDGLIFLRADNALRDQRSRYRKHPLHDTSFLRRMTPSLTAAYGNLVRQHKRRGPALILECRDYDFVSSATDQVSVVSLVRKWLLASFRGYQPV